MPNQGAIEVATHQVFQDIEVAVQEAYGDFDKRIAIKDLLTIPCREAGHPNFTDWSEKFTPVTFSIEREMMLVLIDVTVQPFSHGPAEAYFISSLALELTIYFQTLVAPAQRSDERTHLVAPSGRKFTVFKFALVDKPSRLL